MVNINKSFCTICDKKFSHDEQSEFEKVSCTICGQDYEFSPDTDGIILSKHQIELLRKDSINRRIING